MRAVTFSEFGGPEQIAVIDTPDPVPGEGEVLVAVRAASINPVDASVLSGAVPPPVESLSPYTPGWDLAGTVIAFGDGVDAGLTGAYVLGFSPWFVAANGTQASLVALPAEQVAVAPEHIPPEQLTTLGLNALTALQVVRAAGLAAGSTVLITGASGAVGGFAVEIAAQAGATVIAMAKDDDAELVTGFGAAHAVPRDANEAIAAVLEIAPGGVDVVIDTASLGSTILGAAKRDGRYLTVTRAPDAERGIRTQRVGVKPDPDDLAEVVARAADGRLALRVEQTFDAGAAADAYRTFEAGSHRGRIVLTFGE